ncbi:MAG: AcrR family transcriptional regulator [Gammaproteobacteria bacterium]|jgi:AcrR family transcriptional regulator
MLTLHCKSVNRNKFLVMVVKKKQSAHRTPLSRDRILKAAINLAGKEGIDSISMRKIAQTLKVEAMSLYNHVGNKEDLLDGMVDRVASGIELPDIGGDWKKSFRKRANSAHAVLLKHPWASMLILSRINVGPAMLAYVNATIGCLREAGFTYAMADHAWNAVDNHIYGFTLQVLNFPFEPSEYANAAKAFLPMIPEQEFPHLRGMAIEVIEGRHHGVQDFEFGLELILDGLERLLAIQKRS